MRLSVTARIALLAITLAFISNLLLVAFVWQQIHDDAIDALRRDTTEQSDAFMAVYRSGGLAALRGAIDQTRAVNDDSLIAAIIDRSGKRLAGQGPDLVATGRAPGTAFRVGLIGTMAPWDRHEAGYAVRPIGRYRLLSGRLLDDWEQEQRGIERALALATLLSLALGISGGLVVTRYVGQRLNRIAAVIEGVAEGDLTRRAGTSLGGGAGGGDAFDRLAIRLDAMLDKVARLMGELRVVTDSLAHDLRSPLARLRSRAESASLSTDPLQRDAALSGLIAETDIVMRMLSTLIDISRAESISRDRFASIDPVALIEEIAEFYAPVVEEAGLRFVVVLDAAPPALPLHRELMSQAIANLIENALRHAGMGGEIVLRVIQARGTVRLQVEDRGPGIALGDISQVRRRFGRLDAARTTPGAGLGLALVEAVAHLHGGTLDLDDNAPGLIAAIVLPLV